MTWLFNFVNGILLIIDRPRSYYDHLDSITPVIGSRVSQVGEYIMELHLYHWNQKCMKLSNSQPKNAGLLLWLWAVAFGPYFTHRDLMSDSALLFYGSNMSVVTVALPLRNRHMTAEKVAQMALNDNDGSRPHLKQSWLITEQASIS